MFLREDHQDIGLHRAEGRIRHCTDKTGHTKHEILQNINICSVKDASLRRLYKWGKGTTPDSELGLQINYPLKFLWLFEAVPGKYSGSTSN